MIYSAITTNPDTSSKKMWMAGGVVALLVALALLYFLVLKKSPKPNSQPQPSPSSPSMQMQFAQSPSMKFSQGPDGCIIEEDCQKGYVCRNRTCILASNVCSIDENCQYGYVCQNNMCQPSMKMQFPRGFQSIGTGVPCKDHSDCSDGNGCGLVTNDPNKQCCRYGAHDNQFGSVCLDHYCEDDSDCGNNPCGIVDGVTSVRGRTQAFCCQNGARSPNMHGRYGPGPDIPDELGRRSMDPSGSSKRCK